MNTIFLFTMSTTGDTLGGIGSAIALRPGSFTKTSNGTFTGTIIAQPDGGFNVYVFLDAWDPRRRTEVRGRTATGLSTGKAANK